MQYIASPYSHPNPMQRHANFMSVAEHTAFLLKRDIMAFSPVAHCHYLATAFGLPQDFEWWKNYDIKMLDNCEALRVLMITGWKESQGVTFEIEYAKNIGLRIFHDEFCKESTSYFQVQDGYEIGVDLADKEEPKIR